MPERKVTSEQIAELVRRIVKCSTEYYEDGTSPVSDKEFDEMVATLKKYEPSHPVLTQTGWGCKVLDGVEHLYQEIRGIDLKFKTLEDVMPYVAPKKINFQWYWIVTPKLDGASVVCYYKDDILQNCITRGDGIVGRDVTANLIDIVPLDLKQYYFTGYVRCEVVIKKEDFEKNFDDGRSLRNTATGLMGAKNPDPEQLKFLQVIPIEVFDATKYTKVEDGIEVLEEDAYLHAGSGYFSKITKEFGKVIPYNAVSRDYAECLTQETMARLSQGYLCDGLVVTIEKLNKAFAYKFDDDTAESVVEKIEWVPQDTGKLFPTIYYKPVQFLGCEATKASGKSAKYILNNGVGVGAKISLVRSGDVIPNIKEVLVKVPFETTGKIVCSHGCDPIYVEIDGSHAYCKSPTCPAKVHGMFVRLVDTFAPKRYDIKTLTILMKYHKYNIFDFLEFLKTMEKSGDFSVGYSKYMTDHGLKLTLEMIEKICKWKLTLEQLARIVVIEYFGATQSKELDSKSFSDRELTDWAKTADSVKSFAPDWIVNVRAVENWVKRHHIVKEMLKYFTLICPARVKKNPDIKGAICITGKVEGMKKATFANKYIIPEGYTWTDIIDEATILIDAEGKESSKILKAKKKGIKIIPIKEWVASCENK
jgi:DNA ligase (NAD+)